jgi:O-antigen ligase
MPAASSGEAGLGSLGPPAPAWVAAALAAVALPALVAFNQTPSSTFYNQAAAVFGWGLLLLVLGRALPMEKRRVSAGGVALLVALGLVALAAGASTAFGALPLSLATSAWALLAPAALVASVAMALRGAGLARPAFAAFAIGLAVAAVGSALVALVQVFAPSLADGSLIAASTTPGRAVGNLRQPNHLASLLLWGLIALVWLGEAGLLRRRLVHGLAALMLVGVVLSASRTGIVGALLLALWGAADRRLARPGRALLLVMPLGYALLWAALVAWAHASGASIAAETRLTAAGGDLSSSRFAIWSDTLGLLRRVPWTGVGFGEFNFAWSLTAFPHRPTAFFDHTHNLPLHLLVELGLPLGGLVLALLLAALVGGWRTAAADAQPASVARAALALVVMIGVHSLLEYPLWYAYFLLPAAFAFGLVLGLRHAPAVPERTRLLPVVSAGLMAAALLAVADFQRVVVIFAPPRDAAPLATRIHAGQRSLFFAHHADYAAATATTRPERQLDAFDGATHFLLDTRLMIAWAQAFHALGDEPRALHLADRLREFRNADSDEFLAPCQQPDAPRFPCASAPLPMDWRDFLPPRH